MKKLLHVRVWRTGCTVRMKILEQAERLRGVADIFESNLISPKMTIESCNQPELRKDIVFIRGYRKKTDEHTTCITFEDETAANYYLFQVKKLFREYKKLVEGKAKTPS